MEQQRQEIFVPIGTKGLCIKVDEYNGRYSLVMAKRSQDGMLFTEFCHGTVKQPQKLPPEMQPNVVELHTGFGTDPTHRRYVWNKPRPHGIFLGASYDEAVNALDQLVMKLKAGNQQPLPTGQQVPPAGTPGGTPF